MTKRVAGRFAIVAALASGCAATPDDRNLYEAGWRTGYISAVGPSAALPAAATSDCRIGASPGALARTHAVVTYVTRRGALERRIVPLDGDSLLATGDWVDIDLRRCDLPPARHTGVREARP